MISTDKVKQYLAVYNYVKDNPGSSRKKISNHLLSIGLAGVPERTFERLKIELISIGTEIKYDYTLKGYKLEDPSLDNIEEIDLLFQSANTIGYLAKDLEELKKIQEFVQISTTSNKGKEHLQELVDSCLNSCEVEFYFKKYEDKVPTPRRIQPYLIKELKGRWYVIGIEPKEKITRFRAYGLERMSNLKNGERFAKDENLDAKARYKDVVGMFTGENYQKGSYTDTKRVVLQIDKISWKWIESLPWHHSQKKLKENDGIVEFELFVKPTKDLERLILEWTPAIKVIEPEKLKEDIVEQLKKAVYLNK